MLKLRFGVWEDDIEKNTMHICMHFSIQDLVSCSLVVFSYHFDDVALCLLTGCTGCISGASERDNSE